MSDFKAKMHQIQFRPRPHWGSLQCSPDPLAGFKGPTSKGRKGREGKGGDGDGAKFNAPKFNAPNSISPQTPLGELTVLPRPPSWI